MKGVTSEALVYRVEETDAPAGERDIEVLLGSGVGRRFVARRLDGGGATGVEGGGVLLVRVFPLAGRDLPVWKDAIRGWGERGGPVVLARLGECSVAWTHGCALIAASGEGLPSILAEVVEFAVGEEVLLALEGAMEAGWGELECDAALAYRVERLDRVCDGVLKERALETMRRRLLFMRWEPLWLGTGLRSGARMRRLGDALLEEAEREDRCATLDARIEAAEYVYELVGQRAGEFRHAREGYWIEWVIVVLLAAELAVMLLEYFG
jgi:hypothetical protein